ARGVEHRGLDAAGEVGAVLGADDVAVAVPGHVDRAAGLLLEGGDDVLGDLADDRVLDADHVPVVDRDPAQIALGLAERQIGREGGGDAERGEGAAALEEGAAALGGGELAGHEFLPEFLVDVTDTIRGFRPQGPRPKRAPGLPSAAPPPLSGRPDHPAIRAGFVWPVRRVAAARYMDDCTNECSPADLANSIGPPVPNAEGGEPDRCTALSDRWARGGRTFALAFALGTASRSRPNRTAGRLAPRHPSRCASRGAPRSVCMAKPRSRHAPNATCSQPAGFLSAMLRAA